MTSKNLGRILKQARLMMGLSLRTLAAKSGVSVSHLGRIERGDRFPSARILQKIARPLGFEETGLFYQANFLSPKPPVAESERDIGQLDPYVARVLSQEPVEVQRTLIGIFNILKSMAKGIGCDIGLPNTPTRNILKLMRML